MSEADTVFALSTAPGKAGIAVVRVSGPAARAAVETLAPPVPKARTATLRTISEQASDVIDHGLVLWFEAPRTETGEDMAEFHLHGSMAVTAALLEALGRVPGCRPAEPGEFARRAFFNGKLDLTAVEGLADLIEAETAAQRRQAVLQLGGALGRLYEGWRRGLIDILALAEAGIDFIDEEDVPRDVWETARPEIEHLIGAISGHLADGNRGERIREGATLVIAGPPNAGKSSLMNWLARRDVAIVSEIPGTTRDAIEVRLDLGGVAVTAIDTAGLREAADVIEEEGIRRAEARIAAADLVLWVEEANGAADGAPGADCPVWRIFNKIDLAAPPEDDCSQLDFAVSVTRGEGLDRLLAELSRHFSTSFEAGASPVITRERHRRELGIALAALKRAGAGDYEAMPDVVAEDLRIATSALGRITGRIDVEDILDVIFRDFCIGK